MRKKSQFLFMLAIVVILLSCGKHGEPDPDDDANLVLDEAVAVELPEVSIPLVKTIKTKEAEVVNGRDFMGCW